MQIIIHPSSVNGIIQAPASKSSMQRACAAALLAGGETIIANPGHSNDDQSALRVIQFLGAMVEPLENGSIRIISRGIHPDQESINCGESGLGIRMFAPIIALSEKEITINGEGSLLTRPMDFFDDVLPKLDVAILSNNGKLPLKIRGPLKPKNIVIDGSLSSQFLTGLLLSFAAAHAQDVTIRVKGLKSKPYIDLTVEVMKKFGWIVENRNYEDFYFPSCQNGNPLPIRKKETPLHYTVEGDWSGSAFLLVAGAIAGKITVKGLDANSAQADKAILQALRDCGAESSWQSGQVRVGTGTLKSFHFNASDCPDLFPPLVALASYCGGKTIIEGVHRLAHKESNRAQTLVEEFGKMGVQILLEEDKMMIMGGKGVKGTRVHSRNDHRIAMACAVAALGANRETVIEEAEAVNKSYPGFYDDIRKLQPPLKENFN